MKWKTLKERAYVPYSKKPVACIIEGASGKYYPGVRIENVSFPLTIPAIQAACCFCLADGDIPAALHKEEGVSLEQSDFWMQEFDLKVFEKLKIDDIKFTNPTLSFEDGKVLSTLIELLEKAITVHSNFPVSALLYCKEGIIPGTNVEVSEWTKGLCAERLAIARAFSYGYSKLDAMSLHTLKGEFSSPCGACRQVIYEHMQDNRVDFYHADHTLSVHYTGDLLPLSFSSKSLTE